jgi:hypothetical protein
MRCRAEVVGATLQDDFTDKADEDPVVAAKELGRAVVIRAAHAGPLIPSLSLLVEVAPIALSSIRYTGSRASRLVVRLGGENRPTEAALPQRLSGGAVRGGRPVGIEEEGVHGVP